MKLKIVLLLLFSGIVISVSAVSAVEMQSADTVDDDSDWDDFSWDSLKNYTPSAGEIGYEICHNPVVPFNPYEPSF